MDTKENNDDITSRARDSKGGRTTLARHGKDFYSMIGRKGNRSVIKKYGTDYFKRLSKAGVDARRAKRERERPLLEKIRDIVTPQSSQEEQV